MAKYLLFRTSRSAFREVSELYDFMWPTAAALWNLRWQVRGFTAEQPQATVYDLQNRFVLGSGIHSANLVRACLQETWEEQQEQLAKYLLVDLFALYEGWLAATLRLIGHSKSANSFQGPTEILPGKAPRGVGPALVQVHASRSRLIGESFYDGLLTNRKNSLAKIEPLLKCYRCFKECRNVLVHAGGIADQKAEARYADYAILTATDLGVSERAECNPVVLGERVCVSLRGVVGFSDVVLRLIATLDAELALAESSERELREQWLARHGRRITLKANRSSARSEQVQKLVVKLGMPKPQTTVLVEKFLLDHGLVH